MLDVLPPALVRTAAAVRSFGRELEPPALHGDVGDAALAGALADFRSRWALALGDLADAAEGCAQTLHEGAEEYVSLDALLVPRSLR